MKFVFKSWVLQKTRVGRLATRTDSNRPDPRPLQFSGPDPWAYQYRNLRTGRGFFWPRTYMQCDRSVYFAWSKNTPYLSTWSIHALKGDRAVQRFHFCFWVYGISVRDFPKSLDPYGIFPYRSNFLPKISFMILFWEIFGGIFENPCGIFVYGVFKNREICTGFSRTK